MGQEIKIKDKQIEVVRKWPKLKSVQKIKFSLILPIFTAISLRASAR